MCVQLNQQALVAGACSMQHAHEPISSKEECTRVIRVRAIVHEHCSVRAHRMQLCLEALPVARHAAAPRREEHAARAALDEQRRCTQPKTAQATSDHIQAVYDMRCRRV